jgi:3-(3-hydroxy-phenyl)propionate hydroxylase
LSNSVSTEQTSNQNQQFDVIIVGLGPTGATLANLLGDQGLSVLVLEREADIYDLPRAVHFDDEVMRIFQSIGISDEMSKNVFVNKGMRFVDNEGNLLVDWPRPQEKSPNGWFPSYRFHQPDLERILRNGLAERNLVTAKLQQTVKALVETADGVAVHYVDASGHSHDTATAKYVVGCDGARSMVRQTMDSQMEPLGFEQRWLVVDVMLKREMPELGDFTVQFCDSTRPATYCRNVGLRRRWEFALLDTEDSADAVRKDHVWTLLSRWISPENAQLERSAVYTFKSEIADTWVRDRLCLAGDSAHLTPPFLGQGMCAGIRDAANLAWKLAAACRRTGSSRLLTSYQTERKPNVAEYIGTAVELGELINRMGTQKAQDKNRRDGPVRMNSVRARLGPGLGPADDRWRGVLIPQFTLANGRRLDEVVGHRHALITRSAKMNPSVSDDLYTIAADSDSAAAALLDQLGVDAVLLRPDKHILCTASGPNADADVMETARRSDILNEAAALT